MPINFKVNTRIKINGVEYNSPDEMPPDLRALYEKALANRQSGAASLQVHKNSKFTFNGQTYNSPDEMPADVRKMYDSVMAVVDKDGDGIPDAMEQGGESALQNSVPLVTQQKQVVSDSKPNAQMMLLVMVLLIVALALAGVVLVLLRRG